MIGSGIGDIFSKPCRRLVGIGLFFGIKFYFCQKKPLIIIKKNIQLNGKSLLFRYKVTGFGENNTVCLRFQM